MEEDLIGTAREWVQRARAVAVVTGAGVSAESGIPTFRGPGGLWREFRPEDLANRAAFARDPKLVWEWYLWRRARIRRAEPNPGHAAITKLEQNKPVFTLITQNVDGLHDRAGSRHILKVHGDIWITRCVDCEREQMDRRVRIRALPPLCPACGGKMRPGVVWFGEMLPMDVWQAAVRAVEECDLLLVLGTSAVVYPVAALPDIALRRGIPVIEINPETTLLSSRAGISLRGKTGELLPILV